MKKRILVGFYCGVSGIVLSAVTLLLMKLGVGSGWAQWAACFAAGFLLGFLFAPLFTALDPAKRKRRPYAVSLAAGILAAVLVWPLTGLLMGAMGGIVRAASLKDVAAAGAMYAFVGLLTPFGWPITVTIVLLALALTAWDEWNKRAFQFACAAIGLILGASTTLSMLYLDQKKLVVREATWEYASERPEMFGSGYQKGQRGIMLTYVDAPETYEVAYSNKLAAHLESLGQKTVPVTMEVWYDFGRERAYNVTKIGDMPYNPALPGDPE